MKKGKFGIVLCFYPIAAFAAAVLASPLIAAALAAAAIFIERDEWAARQSLQAWMLSVLVSFAHHLCGWASGIPVPFLSAALTVTSAVLYVIIALCVIIFSILGIIRVMKDEEANIPLLADLAYRVFGSRKPKPAVTQMPPMGFQPPYGYPQQPDQAAQAQVPQYPPYPQQPQPPQQPVPPQYTPPVNVPPAQGNDQGGPTSL